MCQYAKDVGMERVGHCPAGQCVYQELFVLTAGREDTFVGVFVSEQNALAKAWELGYDDYSVNPTRLM